MGSPTDTTDGQAVISPRSGTEHAAPVGDEGRAPKLTAGVARAGEVDGVSVDTGGAPTREPSMKMPTMTVSRSSVATAPTPANH
jgi:hypothetical protein